MNITCERFLVKMLARFGMSDCHPVATPLSSDGDDKSALTAPALQDAELKFYLQAVGCLQWVASTLVRPDLAVAAQVLGAARSRATTWHMGQLKRALRYCKGTTQLGVRLARATPPAPLRLVVRCDSNWAGCKVTRASVSGAHSTLAGMPAATICKKQGTVACASTHAETICMSEVSKRIMTWRRLLGDLGFPQRGPTLLVCDNQAAIALSENQLQLAELSRHLATRHLYVRELVGRGFVRLQFVRSKLNAADFVTKSHTPVPFLIMRGFVMGHDANTDFP